MERYVKNEKHVFRINDSDNGGFNNFDEFLCVIHIMADVRNEKVLRKVSTVFDVNNDERISRKEITKRYQ